jgi:hypothetical protein
MSPIMTYINEKHKLQLLFRGTLLILTLISFVFFPTEIIYLLTYPIGSFKIYHLIWLITILYLIYILLPFTKKDLNTGKIYARFYKENPRRADSDKERLRLFTKNNNLGALKAFILWFGILLPFLILYLLDIISSLWIFGIVVLAFFLDEVCIAVWCPFRNWLIKNKCCNSCRIHNWGPIMVFFAFIVIPSFWTYSLIFVSLLILIQWEYLHYRHPERFYEYYNLNLRCDNCTKKAGKCLKEVK